MKFLNNFFFNFKKCLYPLKSIFNPIFYKHSVNVGKYHENNSAYLNRELVNKSIKEFIFERDGFLNVEPYISSQLKKSIIYLKDQNKNISILDIGGSFGNNYRTILMKDPYLGKFISNWTVIELEDVIQNSDGLEQKLFFYTWDQFLKMELGDINSFNIIFLSASFQYFSSEYVSKFLHILYKIKNPHFILFDRLLINKSNKNLEYKEKIIRDNIVRYYNCNAISLNYLKNLLKHIGYEKIEVNRSLGSPTFTSDFKHLSYKSVIARKYLK